MKFSSSHRITFMLLAGIGACGPLFATPVRFVPMTQEIAERKISIKDSKGITNMKGLSAKERSKPYELKAGKKPLELTTPDLKDAEGKPASLQIPVPPEIKSPLILLLLDSNHPSGIRAICMEDSITGFTWGTVRFLNLTEDSLTLRFGEERKLLPEGNSPVDIPAPTEAHNVGVQLYKEETPAKILYSAVWEHDSNFRKLIIITPGADPLVKPLDLQVLPEDKRIKK